MARPFLLNHLKIISRDWMRQFGFKQTLLVMIIWKPQ